MKYVLVTGGYGGMGRKTCQELIKQGFVVFALDLKVEEKQDNLIPLQVDITNEESIVNAFNDVKKITDNLFAIIHFAGIYMLDSLFEIETKNFERIFNINLKGVFLINKIFKPLLLSGSKIIITTSELAPLDPLPFTGIYAISKASLDKYAYSLRMEAQLLNISISVIRAGAVKTNMLNTSTNALNNFCNKTELYKCNSKRFKKIVDSVEAKNILPSKIANKTIKILKKKNPKFAYKINNNFYLKLLNILPKRLQFYIIRQLLK